ncbi:MAG: adenylyl-sulfate kinase [Candidatus Andersenbacteria bacterium]|nr:adenylyl-sulfate kinase [Candidatus Andersenbacteria bacterium]MBI3251262.1 adenylyl-sulfate kinase [Candidatus Andersenbacteria bacterium]
MQKEFPIIWLTGNTGAGKTTVAFGAQRSLRAADDSLGWHLVILDGDEMRESISLGATLSAQDRHEHNLRVARLAQVLQKQGLLVVVAVIAPFATTRQEVTNLCQPRWVYIQRSGLGASDKPYEIPENPDLVLDHNTLSIEASREAFITFLRSQ